MLKFNEQLAAYSASEFVEDILLKKLGIKALVVGDDFRFGKKREGDYKLLSSFSERKNFVLERAAPFLVEGERVSSTLVRNHLESGSISRAEKFWATPALLRVGLVAGTKRRMGLL